MLFEVNSFYVAKNIDFVIQRDAYREADLVVLLPDNYDPLPMMVHGNDWKIVDCFVLVDFDKTSIEKYRALNAIIIEVKSNNITFYDISGFAMLELKCEYRDAVEYLEYLFQWAY